MSEFKKYDSGKPLWSLLPFDAVELVVRVMTMGALKYGRDNWRAATDADCMRYIDALMRHYAAFARGEVTDPESGLPHLAHLACNAVFLLWHKHCKQAEEKC